MVERPIRVADVIELDGTVGTVAQIGARSTKIATSGNREMIVPNSKLLETNVINWTLSDDVGGCAIKVGVSYGSPAREVERLLKHAANSHPQVIQDPLPDVVFADFGDDALVFELRFRVNLRDSRKSDIESELRFAIDELFSARGIVMAYPQRDVHLNVLRPVEVRLAQPASSAQPISHLKAA
jgi:small-conductance mechanosensitive channel